MGWILNTFLIIITCGDDFLTSFVCFLYHLTFPMAFIILFFLITLNMACKCSLATYSTFFNFNLALAWDILAMYLASSNSNQYIMVNSYSWMHSRVYMDNNRHVFWLFRLEDFYSNLVEGNMRLTCRLAYVNLLFLDNLDLVAQECAKHMFKAWIPFFNIWIFYALPSDGPVS
ncbi:hypothetical protein AX15_002438 [Amanita polypyramis BW_CC]|nr:hypothetical protein AX15_002438 [Amanita polypyramis BW_CC]